MTVQDDSKKFGMTDDSSGRQRVVWKTGCLDERKYIGI